MRMKIVEWDDDTVPHVEVNEYGDTTLEDSIFHYGLEEGDQVHYVTEIGTSVYHVVEVTPIVSDGFYPEGMTYVVLKAA